MPLSFLLVLFTYSVVAAAGIRFNNSLSGGVINTFTLGIVLFAGIMAWKYGLRRPFWVGFFFFFTGLQILDLARGEQILFWYTLHGAMGEFLNAKLSSRPITFGVMFQDPQWYIHVSNCFVATAFGLIGAFVTAKALGRDVARSPRAVDK
jgi:hypothetical protein